MKFTLKIKQPAPSSRVATLTELKYSFCKLTTKAGSTRTLHRNPKNFYFIYGVGGQKKYFIACIKVYKFMFKLLLYLSGINMMMAILFAWSQ